MVIADSGRASSVATFVASDSPASVRHESDIEKGSSAEKLLREQSSSLRHISFKQWMIVLGAFIVFLNTWGFVLSLGAFQTYYEEVLLTNKTSSEISWVSTFCACISVVAGLITGPLYDRGYLRALTVGGCLLQVFGMMMISLSTEYYQVFLSQGVCVGLGMAMLYVPTFAYVTATFNPAVRPKVVGLVASATGLGGVIYPIVFQRLLGSIGFPWTVRCMGFIVLVTYIVSCVTVFIEKSGSLKVRAWIDKTAFTDKAFLIASLGCFFFGMAYYLPLLYIPSFAETSILSEQDSDLGFYLLSIIHGVSFVGRIGAGLVAARFGPVETTTFSLATSGVVLICWTGVSSKTGLIVWSIFWGLSSSIIVATVGSVIPVLSPSIEVIGTRVGMCWAAVGLGLLVGGPIGGALVDEKASEPAWWHIEICAGLFMLTAAVLYIQPVAHVRRKAKGSPAV